MQAINNFFGFLQNIEINQIVDIIIALIIVIVGLLISPFISYGVLRIFYKKENKEEIKKAPIYKNIRTFINFSAIYGATKVLNFNFEQNEFIDKLYRIVIIWTIANLISGTLELNEALMDKLNKKKRFSFTRNDKFMVTIISKIVRVILYIIAAYLSLKEFNYDLGGLATGLGIGGAIIALAAQDIVKQLLAGFAIISDKPFEIGDWISVGDIAGNVETITWRSTKIRTLDDTVITMDNSMLIKSNIVNWGKIKKRIFRGNIKLALETDERTIEKVINRIKFILKYDATINKEHLKVELSEIQAEYLNIYIFAETSITNYDEYTAFCNKTNLTILNILETLGVKLAYPGKNIYIQENKNTRVKGKEKIEIIEDEDKKDKKDKKAKVVKRKNNK